MKGTVQSSLLQTRNPNVNVVELDNAMSVEGVHPEITGDRPCDGLRVDLKRCLLQVCTCDIWSTSLIEAFLLKSDCCLKSHKTPLQCLQDNEVPQECQALRLLVLEIKISDNLVQGGFL